MNQQILDRLIGPAPASTVDVDRVIRRTLRRRLLRRTAAAGSAATAVVAAVALGVSLAGGPRRPGPLTAAPPPSVTPTVPVPVASAPPAVAVLSDTQEEQGRTLELVRAALDTAKAEHAPGTAWIYMPDVPGEPRTPDGQVNLWVSRSDGRPVSFEGRSGITGGGRKGGFYLSLRPAGCTAGQACSPLYECAAPIHECSQGRTPSGLQLVRWVDKPGKGWHFYGVDIALRDGEHALRLQAVNYFGGDGSRAVAPTPVLTRAQLDAIATDIADTFTG